MLTLTDNQFYTNRTWDIPLVVNKPHVYRSPQWVDLFDQNGYRLTILEDEYAIVNNQKSTKHRGELCLRKDWLTQEPTSTGAHVNHAFLFERKGYSGAAAEQLKEFAKENNLLYKLVNYVGKWGVDFSMDYVDETGNTLELLHFEFDSYNLDEILEIKAKVQDIVLNVDWQDAADYLIKNKDKWYHLDFFAQSDWKCNYFGLPSERFKMLAWE